MTAQIVVNLADEFAFSIGKETFITYSKTSFTGVPQLTYKTQLTELHFSGEQINIVETEIGTLVTVIIQHPQNPDVGGNLVKLTLLIPIVNLLATGGEIKVKTEAIVTTQKVPGNIHTPLTGQIQTYEVLSLTGTARFVVS